MLISVPGGLFHRNHFEWVLCSFFEESYKYKRFFNFSSQFEI